MEQACRVVLVPVDNDQFRVAIHIVTFSETAINYPRMEKGSWKSILSHTDFQLFWAEM